MAVEARSEPVTVRLSVGASQFRVDNPTEKIDGILNETLAYFENGAKFSDAYANGWDGYQRLYDREDHTAPVGLLDRAKSALDAEGYNVRVTDGRDSPGGPITTEWRFSHDLRGYQREAVESVLSNGGGVVSLPTGAGKTVVALRLVHSVGRRTVIFVHSKELLYQWASQIRDILDVDPGVIGDGVWSEGPVTVAIMDTLVSRGGDRLGSYDVAVYDEAHKTSAAQTFHDVGQTVEAPLRVGLSATPWRKVEGEELKIEGATGGVAFEVTAEELIEAGHLARPVWRVVDPMEFGDQRTANPNESYNHAYRRCLVECDARNQAVAKTAADLARDGRSVLVSVDRIAHGEAITSRLADSDGAAGKFLCGSDASGKRRDVIDSFGRGEVLVSTLLREGVDLPELNAIVLAGGGKSKVKIVQQIGRALRPSGGDTAVVVDVRDRGEYLGEHFETRRATCRDYYGRFGPNIDPDVHQVREWLAEQDVPTEELTVTKQSDGSVRIEITGWVDDFEHFRDLMSSAGAQYDQQERANYVDEPSRLPEVDDG